ncbi:UDP-glucose:acetate beta-D-glucosyltransferase [Vigna unguiculata]|uniref:UDP-glucose:acetate beta-D-glucosyltransferase n=1 Tax=Vigna unguiculata TaxID=3917 RepID=A0A4D6MLN8_VIGUN|nr:UDP-glucose:acetate beta-D-glucosyltransferase [Vigna unguiculata]
MKKMKKELKKEIVILVPYPAQGHVTPMQNLARAFLAQGFYPLIVLPHSFHRKIHGEKEEEEEDGLKWVGLGDGMGQEEGSPDFFAIESAMEKMMPSELEGLIEKVRGEGGEVACVVVDLLASWAIESAHKRGIPVAGFWPAMLASYLFIASIPLMLNRRLLSHTGLPQREGKFSLHPELPVISTEDLPWLVGTEAARKGRFRFWKRTLERSSALKWLLVNSFPDESKLEAANRKLSSEGCPRVLPIGPICRNGITKGVSFWEEDMSCLKWVAKQKRNSVIYISFGSWVSPIGEAKLRNLAVALEGSGRPFIWVLRSSWRQGLPNGFLERVEKEDRGRVVSWAPQKQILQHESVACYITHCGWNSILEALQFQKKLLCYPVAGDQFVNCAFVVEVWKVGLKLNGVEANDVEEGIVRVVEDKEMEERLRILNQRIMAGNNNTGASIFKTFLEDLKRASSTTTTTQDASEINIPCY